MATVIRSASKANKMDEENNVLIDEQASEQASEHMMSIKGTKGLKRFFYKYYYNNRFNNNRVK